MLETSAPTNFASLLRANGIAPTRQRLGIARLILATPCHLSAEQVIERLGPDAGSVSRATVYNTLRLFTRHNLLREVVVGRGRVFFDSNMRPHHHVYDVTTGTLRDIPGDDIGFSRLPALPVGTEVEGVEVVVRVKTVSAG